MRATNLKKIDRELYEVSKHISFLSINPVNEEEEKQKFFSSKRYNPQFRYEKPGRILDRTRRKLEKMRISNGALAVLFEQKRREYIRKIDMAKAVGTKKLTSGSKKVYGCPDGKLVAKARKMMGAGRGKEPGRGKKLSTKQIINYMRLAFLKYGVHWKIREKDMPAEAAVISPEKTLYIKKNAKFSKQFLKRLIAHEVGTHILRTENGKRQPYLLFEEGLAGYLMTEEGLAVYNEEIHKLSNKAVLKRYAGRVLAVNKALKSSFRETYNYLRKYFSKEESWKLTVRAKRGLADTSMHGAFTKDYLYLKGYCEVKDYAKKGGSLHMLYYGKVGIQHIKHIKHIKGMVNPKYIPIYRYFQYFADILARILNFQMRFFIAPIWMPFEKTYHPLKRGIRKTIEYSVEKLDSSFETINRINKNNKKGNFFFGWF